MSFSVPTCSKEPENPANLSDSLMTFWQSAKDLSTKNGELIVNVLQKSAS
jgi:hypothetical protein